MKKESPSRATVFFQKGNKKEYLLLNYLKDLWDFLEEYIEPYDKPEETVTKEIKEKTFLGVFIIKDFQEKITYTFRH